MRSSLWSTSRLRFSTLEEVSPSVEPPQALGDLLTEARDRRPELLALKERVRTAEHRIRGPPTC